MSEKPLSHPTELAGLIEYQPGAVVSRVLLKNSGGVMSLFAFDAGEGLSEHSTPHDATVQILEGKVTVEIAGESHTVRAGQTLRLPSAVPHALIGEQRFKMLLTLLTNPVS
ncbi:MAG: cupin domain-containing protein [Gemmatimonadales bacterium]|jgi:quercetin dioxygenase-like cupin family protein|nr:cupin domain-containing protein [Gemmatimonadales bacterium]MBT3498109.1 cupin domain-containing protein [Gemmatimonadales bacterium]MBT3775486.1 cupin domain-containing protein [Gemmatimonadales bacterium]MBT3959944.1 cupin domain-containing protein [Gemmatimonadales bacterium]MBT4187652.1 cupin domain-containing protein [Gemmatimonadales bacterium]